MKSKEPSTTVVHSPEARQALTVKELSSTGSQPQLITAAELASYLRISRRRVYQLVRDGVLPGVIIGRAVRFDPYVIKELVRRGGASFAHGWRKEAP